MSKIAFGYKVDRGKIVLHVRGVTITDAMIWRNTSSVLSLDKLPMQEEQMQINVGSRAIICYING